MPDHLTLRRAGAADIATLTAVIHQGFSQYRGRLVPESSAHGETEATVRDTLEQGGGVLAETPDGRAVGAVLFEPRDGDALYLGRLTVLAEARGQGLAARLVAAVEAAARSRGLVRVTLGVRLSLADNIRLFTRLGYREIGREAHPGFSEPTSMNMEKRLE